MLLFKIIFSLYFLSFVLSDSHVCYVFFLLLVILQSFCLKKGMPHVEYFCYNKLSFVSVEFHGDQRTVTKLMSFYPPSVFGNVTRFNIVVSV